MVQGRLPRCWSSARGVEGVVQEALRRQGRAAAPSRPVPEPRRGVATGPGHRWRSRGWPPSTAKQRSDTERKLEQARHDRAPRRPPRPAPYRLSKPQGQASELLARLLAESEDDEARGRPLPGWRWGGPGQRPSAGAVAPG